jgi:hypothetical protein
MSANGVFLGRSADLAGVAALLDSVLEGRAGGWFVLVRQGWVSRG